MIPRSYRLSVSDFSRISTWKRSSFISPYFSVRFYPNQIGFFRYAVVIPASIEPLAVIRNKVRRRFYTHVRQFPSSASFDVVFFVKKPAIQVTYDVLRVDLFRCLESFF